MKYLSLLFVLIGLLGCNEMKENAFAPEYYQTVKKYCSSYPDSTELSIAIIDNEEVLYFGCIKKGDSLINVDNKRSVFGIGSITKIFTSTLLSQFIVDSRIDLNEPIENYLDFELNQSNYNNSKITFKTLANHTSGFPRIPENFSEIVENSKGYKKYNYEILKDYLGNHISLNTEPEYEYSYSNLGYTTLGFILENTKELSYEELLQQNICDKYELNYTTTDYLKNLDLLVSGRDSVGNILPQTDLGLFAFSGGIYSNIQDLTKFVQANFRGDSVLDLQRQETYRWGNFGVALGWQIWNFGGANCKWYYHGGSLEGYRAECVMNLASKNAVIILSNVSSRHRDTKAIESLAFDLIKQEFVKNNSKEECCNSFIEIAINNGWGAVRRDSLIQNQIDKTSIVGVWQHLVNDRFITKTFFDDNKVQTDFYKDEEVDVWGYYEINRNKISFMDIGGAACIAEGIYEYRILGDTLRFKEIFDECEGRKAGNLIDWVRIKK